MESISAADFKLAPFFLFLFFFNFLLNNILLDCKEELNTNFMNQLFPDLLGEKEKGKKKKESWQNIKGLKKSNSVGPIHFFSFNRVIYSPLFLSLCPTFLHCTRYSFRRASNFLPYIRAFSLMIFIDVIPIKKF